jgi:hypothetical protein
MIAQMAIDKIPSGPRLDALTAEKVLAGETSINMTLLNVRLTVKVKTICQNRVLDSGEQIAA